MVCYEIRKVLGTLGGKIALVLLAITVVISCWSAVNGHGTEWINEQGKPESGPAAIAKLRAAKKEWAGPLDTQRLTAAMLENQRIEATPEGQSRDYELNDIAFGWKQGISDIRQVVNNFLSVGFQSYDYYLADSIPISSLPGLYENRVRLLEEWLYSPDSNEDDLYSDAEKAWLVEQYKALDTPMEYDYYLGWSRAAESSPSVMILTALILGYLVAGIFANEFKWRADSIYFSSSLGRSRSTWAKVLAGFWIVTAVYWGCMLVYSLYTLIYLGFDGWNCPIQLERWKCFYNITFLEKYIWILLGGYLGNLFSAFLTMWISARTKTAVVAVTLPFILSFLPNFFQNYEGTIIGKVLGLLPDRLLQINNAMSFFDLYSLGEIVIGAVPLLFPLYFLLTGLLVPLLYREFSRKELL